MGNKLLENIFSIKNDLNHTHKIVRVAGVKIKLRVKRQNPNIFKKIKLMRDSSLYVGIPEDLTLQLMFNNDCNCRCKFCFAEGHTNNTKMMTPQMLYEDLLPLYEKTTNLVPTDGEITYHKEGYEYLSYISKNFPAINVFVETNGIAFNEKWQEMASDNLMRVNFSLNAINNEYFKKTVWEKDGVYDVVIKNLYNYIEMLDRKGLSEFRPSVSCVLNSTNYRTVEEFIKKALELKIQNIIFFFDAAENNLRDTQNAIKDVDGFKHAYSTLMEIEKLAHGKLNLGYKLFFPNDNAFIQMEKDVENATIEDLKAKYPEISALIENFDDTRTLFDKKTKIREAKGKKPYSYYEEITNVCYHQFAQNGKIVCQNAWNHLRLMPDGKAALCAWRPYDFDINNFRKNGKIDWTAFFNCYKHRELRKDFSNQCYPDCMPQCPGMGCVSEEEFNKKYN